MYHHVVQFLLRSLLLILATICITKHINLAKASFMVTNRDSFEALQNQLGDFAFAGYRKDIVDLLWLKGASAVLSVWSLNVADGDRSSSQIKICSSFNRRKYCLIAGWMVNPKIFRDRHPRMFASYEFGNGESCHSFEPNCQYFIITKERYFSQPIQTSTMLGNQREHRVKIIQDNTTRHWMLLIDHDMVGYWNTSSVLELQAHAEIVAWYGEVFKSVHSPYPVPMGSGMFPEQRPHQTSYIRDLQYVNAKYEEKKAKYGLLPYQNKPQLYKVSPLVISYEGEGEALFYYGGPGQPA